MSKPIRRRPPATIIRPRPPSPVDAGPPAAPGRQPGLAVGVVDEVERRLSGRRLEPMMLLLPLDVASELLLDELEAELQHRGGILDRHTGPIGQSPPTVTPSFSAAPLASAPNAAISTSVTRHRCPGVVTASPRHHGGALLPSSSTYLPVRGAGSTTAMRADERMPGLSGPLGVPMKRHQRAAANQASRKRSEHGDDQCRNTRSPNRATPGLVLRT
jgi:hypothetical protein